MEQPRARGGGVPGPSSDQGYAAQLLHDRPDLIALDYAGALVSNLHALRAPTALFSRRPGAWVNA